MINNGTNKQFLESSVNCHIFLPFWVDLRASDGDRDISLRFRYVTAPDRCYCLNQASLTRNKGRAGEFPMGETNRSQTATDVVMVIK